MRAALAAQQHVLADLGLRAWPDGTSSGRYRFGHALYRQVLYEGLGSARRREVHRRIGMRLEAGYGAQVAEVAARLAVHFECGGETAQAVHYWQQAGEQAARRHGYHEAVVSLRKGLTLLTTLPASAERTRDELTLLLILGELLMFAKGLGAPEAGEVYTQAHTLCQQVGEPRQRFQVLRGLYRFHGMQGDAAAGVAPIHQGVVALHGMSEKPYHLYHLALLAEAHGQAGQPAIGLTVVDEAVTFLATAEERWWEPEVYRLQGALLLQLPHPDMPRGVACFHQALTVARAQQARALELRAATSLARLWQQQGKGDEARQVLTAVYSWFTEGFDTADLQEAKALLEALT